MKHDVSTSSQRDEIRQLLSETREVLTGQSELKDEFARQAEQSAHEHQAVVDEIRQRAALQVSTLDTEFTDKLESALLAFEARVEKLNELRNTRSDNTSRVRAHEIASAKQDDEAAQLQLKDTLEHDLEKTKLQQKQFSAKCARSNAELESLFEDVQDYLHRRGLTLGPIEGQQEVPSEWSSVWTRRFTSAMDNATDQLTSMQHRPLCRYMDGLWSILVFVVVLVGLWFLTQGLLPGIMLIPAVTIATICISITIRQIVSVMARKQTRTMLPAIEKELSDAVTALQQAKIASRREAEAALAELRTQCQQQIQLAEGECRQRIRDAETRYSEGRDNLEAAYAQSHQEFERNWEAETQQIRASFEPRISALRKSFETEEQTAKARYQQQRDLAVRQRDEMVERLKQTWSARLAHFSSFQNQAVQALATHTRHLNLTDWVEWQPPTSLPDVVSLGHYDLDLAAALSGPNDEALEDLPQWPVPAVLQFPDNASLMLKSSGEARTAAIGVLQNAMVRMLIAIPPGKVRFTIFDPTGLGQNFSAFMHLADYDERLVGSRIWTESAHIQQRLTDLTEHMENVIQKYLRNEFHSIQDYNDHAGEVAEPFRVLVIANFPTHFSEESMRRLISIANSGPRCGVYTLISVDQSAPLPRHVQLEDLETHDNILVWDEGRFRWEREPLDQFPVHLDDAPDDQTMTTIIKALGRHAEDSNRVEVPFASVAPDEPDWWSGDCAEELSVPLGRAGATQQQSLRLGRGTSQHVLVSGKTGSGKSTLLHALITNAALKYDPEQLQFYLVDFKKGVEFKPYADLQLPHARVVAIESEREFGLSVLQRMDQELRERGDLFRSVGVQTLAAFRQAVPDRPMPRMLLVVDEFQEFFVNDDKIAHEASLLLDRLVRQGRAFGMHLVLGSQTLAGAYTLARSTIGQMAVRIALQCSATDAHLILSEDNTAARLLGRPGEAIYNDANGLFEGNHPFQVVWLPDAERASYLRQLRHLAQSRRESLPPAIVFEGHAAANLRDNSDLQRRLELGPTEESAQNPTAWLGAAVAIKEPTAAVFRAQSGTNLLIVGQNETLSTGILLSSVFGLAAARFGRPNNGVRAAKFQILDGEHDSTSAKRLAQRMPEGIAVDVNLAGPRDAAEVIRTLVETVRERSESRERESEPVYLLINDLARFRDLKPSSEDFGFSSFGDETPSHPAGQLAELLRDGPAVNVHSLVWADSFNNVNRWFDRAILRDFAYRVLFQMSASDSANLMDSAAASQLGQFRAIFYDDDRGESEKFRPYGPPSMDCMLWIGGHLSDSASPAPDDDQGPTTTETNSLV